MHQFEFTARNQDGQAVSGSRLAPSANDLAISLSREELTPICIRPQKSRWVSETKQAIEIHLNPVRAADRVMVCRQLASLLRANVPLSRALKCLADATENPGIRRSLNQVHDAVKSGQELALAMRPHPSLFTPLAISLVQAGEQIGRLDQAFEQIASNLERQLETQRNVWTALRYPILVVSALLVALTLINTLAVPAFARVFARLDVPLPTPTKILIASSDFMIQYGPALLALTLLGIVLAKASYRTRPGRIAWDRHLLKVPFLGNILHMCMLSRFCHSLAMITRAGVPLMTGMRVTAEVTDNHFVRQRIRRMTGALSQGDNLGGAAARTHLFSPLVIQMISVGEEAGTVDELMQRAGDYYESEARYRAQRLSDALQPALLIGLGLLISFVALGVFMPMWSLMDGYL